MNAEDSLPMADLKSVDAEAAEENQERTQRKSNSAEWEPNQPLSFCT